jgi:hypothetical protein
MKLQEFIDELQALADEYGDDSEVLTVEAYTDELIPVTKIGFLGKDVYIMGGTQ